MTYEVHIFCCDFVSRCVLFPWAFVAVMFGPALVLNVEYNCSYIARREKLVAIQDFVATPPSLFLVGLVRLSRMRLVETGGYTPSWTSLMRQHYRLPLALLMQVLRTTRFVALHGARLSPSRQVLLLLDWRLQ